MRTRLPMRIQKLAAKRFCRPLKNAAVCAASRARIARLPHNGIKLDQKKGAQLPPCSTTLVTPDPQDATSTTLELDELWSFVLKKANRSWVWIALCRKTRQVVASTIGDRSKETCLRLWEAIPSAYREGHCFTDFWAAYAAVIPEAQHTPTSGPFCAHDALLFQVGGHATPACLLLFLHRSNRERAILLK